MTDEGKNVSQQSSSATCSSQLEANKSDKSGWCPSCPSGPSERDETNEDANARPQDTASLLVQRLFHSWNADPRKNGGASRDLTSAKLWMNSVASSLHLPPVSTATTTSWHRSLVRSSWYFRSLSFRAAPPHSCVLRSGVHIRRQSTRSSTLHPQRVALPWCNRRPVARTSVCSLVVGWHASVHVSKLPRWVSPSRLLRGTLLPTYALDPQHGLEVVLTLDTLHDVSRRRPTCFRIRS